MDERPAIFALRRGIHGDHAGRISFRKVDPEVAPEARIGGSGRQMEAARPVTACQPLLEFFKPPHRFIAWSRELCDFSN
jgi:hypothetical protein